ncbi:RNHCP domain-containing protein [Alicyclobacillus sp. ALC3]|uniref:RNHCP domain-containing protein n=1 Tax=Alicyclobacillus sp. ALC3 TaxID=2796143 RepID=UPI002378349C|nr:RNHCP domain-containing protein [Alicyclobacillus sp. ALC3]WDL97084.1 RNHCP domain-containing protein [Alicyclobacillus sp. ALC3]
MGEGRKFTDRNEGFTCTNCGAEVPPSATSCRNHCPHCLYSVHLDLNPGDRKANCGGLMVPVAVFYHSKKGYQIVHRCLVCGAERRNVAALEDRTAPDSLDALLAIMARTGR